MGCLHAVYATQRCRAAARHRCYAAGLQVVLRWCAQVHSMVTKLAQFTDIRAALIVGGLSLSVQAATLRTSPEILVATPASPLPAQASLWTSHIIYAASRSFKTPISAIDMSGVSQGFGCCTGFTCRSGCAACRG